MIQVNKTLKFITIIMLMFMLGSCEEFNVPIDSDSNVDEVNSSEITNDEAEIGNFNSVEELQVFVDTNAERLNAGLNTLVLNDSLTQVARDKAQDIIENDYFDHTSLTFGTPFEMLDTYEITYTSAGENLAQGYSADEIVAAWMESPTHKDNIIHSDFTEIGIGIVEDVIVQIFIKPLLQE